MQPLLTSAAEVTNTIGATLRVVCFAIRPLAYAGHIEADAEQLVVEAWSSRLEADIDRATAATAGALTLTVESVVGQGATWGEALADVSWDPGDVLAIGASTSPVNRFFLGSHAARIVNNATVAVILIPRSLTHP